MKNVTSDKRNLWMFPLGTVGRDMIYNLFTNFIFTYILFTRHLTAAQLGAVTAIRSPRRSFTRPISSFRVSASTSPMEVNQLAARRCVALPAAA